MKIDTWLRFGSGWESALFINCEAANIRLVSVDYSPNSSGAELDEEVFAALSYLVNQKLHVIVIVFHTFDFVVSISQAAAELNWIEGSLYITNLATPLSDIISSGISLYPSGNATQVEQFLQGSLNVLINVPENVYWNNLLNYWPTLNATFVNSQLPENTNFTIP